MPRDISRRKLKNYCRRRLIEIAVRLFYIDIFNYYFFGIKRAKNLSFFTASHLRPHHHISLREQLQVAGHANNPIMQGSNHTPITTATTPGSDSKKSIFNRLGIRKPSILSLSSPHQIPSSGSTARTFSLDDLLRPPPRRKLAIFIALCLLLTLLTLTVLLICLSLSIVLTRCTYYIYYLLIYMNITVALVNNLFPSFQRRKFYPYL